MVYVSETFKSPQSTIPMMHICHMVADTPEELNQMAKDISAENYFVIHPGKPLEHIELPAGFRSKAISLGATEATSFEIGKIVIGRALSQIGNNSH